MRNSDAPDQRGVERLRLMTTSHLDDGEFARLLYGKVGDLLGPVFTASLESAVRGRRRIADRQQPLNLFWFAHHTVLMSTLAQLPAVPCSPTATPPISSGSFANSFSPSRDRT